VSDRFKELLETRLDHDELQRILKTGAFLDQADAMELARRL
jgi:hypothetical protein